MTNSKQPTLIKGTISLVSASALTTVIGLISTILITHNLTTEAFGYYTLVLIVVSFLGTLCSMGLELTISRFVASSDNEASKQSFINSAITIRLCAILLVCVISWLGKPLLELLFGTSISTITLLLFIPLLFISESIRTLLRSILQGFFLFNQIGICDIIMWCLNLFFVIALIVIHRFGFAELVLTRVVASLLAGVYALFSIPKLGRFSFKFDQLRKLLKFGFPLQINDILSFIFSRIDTIIIAALLGPTDVAIYEVARRIPDNLRTIYEPFRSVYYPFLSKQYENGEYKKASNLLNDSTRLVSFLTVLGSVITLLFGKEIIVLLFSDKYLPSVPLFILQMVSLSVSLVCNVLGTSLVAVGDSSKPMIINLVHIVVKIIGNFLLIPLFGIMGAAVISVIGPLSTYPLVDIFLRKKLHVRTVSTLTPFLIFIVFTVFIYLLKPVTYFEKTGLSFIFLIPCILLSVITKNDLILILEGLGITSWGLYKRLMKGFKIS